MLRYQSTGVTNGHISALESRKTAFSAAKTVPIATTCTTFVAKPSMVYIERATQTGLGADIWSCTVAKNRISHIRTNIIGYVIVQSLG